MEPVTRIELLQLMLIYIGIPFVLLSMVVMAYEAIKKKVKNV